jgi:drug/metabolite transporter (DMT)-like permease
VTWAYATTRYARVSHEVGSVRVNYARALVAFPAFGLIGLGLHGPRLLSGVTFGAVPWLVVSVLSSYALGDAIFLTAARRTGITTALAIASTYPLWAALFGVFVSGEPLGVARAFGTLLSVVGVVCLVRLSRHPSAAGRESAPRDPTGVVLAILASVLWAVNSVSIKRAAVGLDVFQLNTARYGFALAFLHLQVGRSRSLPSAPAAGWGPVIPALIADAVFGSLFYVYGLSHTDLAVGATLSALAPLVSVPVTIALGEERFSAPRFLAVVATVGGVVLLVGSGGTAR